MVEKKPNNLGLWESIEKTPPSQTKPITGKSYSGNSPKPHWLVRRATETFGPIGIGWGFEIVDEKVIDGAIYKDGGVERMHFARVKVWYKWEGERGEVEHVGGTIFSGQRRNGAPFTDDDAPKKSVTDALVKALSLIGFAGDIFLGRYDDSKYMAELRQEEAGASAPQQQAAPSRRSDGWANGREERHPVADRMIKALNEAGSIEAFNKITAHQKFIEEFDALPEVWKQRVNEVSKRRFANLSQSPLPEGGDPFGEAA